MSEIKTCFKRVDYDLSGLLHYIDIGDIGLPDIQRPFVWSNAKVRDLFDSMYKGFPVGYLLFWENGSGNGSRPIGETEKAHPTPMRLIVDGQQRLTSLYAVFRGKKVLDGDYKHRQIDIAFRPRDGNFEVTDAAIQNDPEWIPNISALWASGKPSYKLTKDFLAQVQSRKGGPLTDEEEEQIAHNLDRLFDLQKYPFTALEISPSVDEEQVADIFVRINSEGVKLNQADFILTLLSVFWDEGRHALERFCRESRQVPTLDSPPSAYNRLIQPDPDQMLRVDIAFGFRRAKLKSVYQILRGKDVETGEYSAAQREKQFAILQSAQANVLKLGHWHQFLSALVGAGFRSSEQIVSRTALLYTYSYYLIGKVEYNLPEFVLQKLVARWFFFALLTSRYTGSFETITDQDLNRVAGAAGGHEYRSTLDAIITSQLTNDYWQITVPAQLSTSSARNPTWACYIAAQNRLNAPVLFSHKSVSELLDPLLKPTKKPLERHHLFPRAWLHKQGVSDLKLVNQIANFALLEWPDNLDISDAPPSIYVPQLQERWSDEEWKQMHQLHGLPEGWEQMEYEEFLAERRKMMAAVIRQGYNLLQ